MVKQNKQRFFAAAGTSLRARPDAGFTLIELMVVMVIIAVLAAIAAPAYKASVQHAKEAVMKEDLSTMRKAIDSYTVDKQKAPQDLGDLVTCGYLKEMPKDPFTQRTDTWTPAQTSDYTNIDETQSGGINDVHSGSQQVSSEGTTYNTW